LVIPLLFVGEGEILRVFLRFLGRKDKLCNWKISLNCTGFGLGFSVFVVSMLEYDRHLNSDYMVENFIS